MLSANFWVIAEWFIRRSHHRNVLLLHNINASSQSDRTVQNLYSPPDSALSRFYLEGHQLRTAAEVFRRIRPCLRIALDCSSSIFYSSVLWRPSSTSSLVIKIHHPITTSLSSLVILLPASPRAAPSTHIHHDVLKIITDCESLRTYITSQANTDVFTVFAACNCCMARTRNAGPNGRKIRARIR